MTPVPIEIIAPLPNTPIGVGYVITAQTNNSGPFPTDSQWLAIAYDSDRVQFSCLGRVPFTQPFQSWTLGFDSVTTQPAISPANATTNNGKPAHLLVQITSPTGGLQEELEQPMTHDNSTGLPYLIQSNTGTQGSFTPDDRGTLQVVEEAVTLQIPAPFVQGGVAAITNILEQLKSPNGQRLCPVEPEDLTGQGTRLRPVPIAPVAALGALFEFITIPPNLSRSKTFTPVYREPIAQIGVIMKDACGFEYVDDLVDIRSNNHKVLWGIPAPERIEYWILPGAVVRMYWLLLQL